MEQMTEMMSNPNFAQMMNEALSNPQIVDMMINQNPQLRAMGPQARQFLQSPQFRQMITNPQALQSMAQLSSSMGMGGPFGGGGGGESAFPAPGVTNTTPEQHRDGGASARDQTGTDNSMPSANPFAALMGGAGPGAGAVGANPFAGMFNLAMMNQQQQTPFTAPQNPSSDTNPSSVGSRNPQQNPFSMLFNPALMGQQTTTDGSNTTNQPPNPFLNNPFLQDPNSMNALMQAMGGANGGGEANGNAMQNLANMLGGANASAVPTDNRPPEERFATQLRQLNEMGFFEFDRNIQALTRSGGDVNGALEWLFGQPS